MRNLPVYMPDVPEYEVVYGQMHIVLGDFEMVMSLHVFMRGVARSQRAIADWERSRQDCEVVAIGGRD